jgi:glycine/D-amino acid oxidase-like deaminating enzyme
MDTGERARDARNSLWFAGEPPGTASGAGEERLDESIRSDVCIVGAGIAGLSAAYMLGRLGVRVVVLDHGPIGGGETGRTTAHLSSALDDRFTRLERMHGRRGARLAAESHSAAIDRIEAIVAEEDIACSFERLDGFLFDPPGARRREVEPELAAARRAGLAVELVDRAPIQPFDTGPALRFLRQAQFHPLRYLHGLLVAIHRDGGRVFGNTHVLSVRGGNPAVVGTAHGPSVTAEAVFVATNSPINDRFAIHTKQAPYRTYVIAGRVPRGSVHKALYWDTPDPYHYVRIYSDLSEPTEVPGGWDQLLIGGEDRQPGPRDDALERFGRLEAWARRRFPMLDTVEQRWSGIVYEPNDGLAFIGRNPGDADNVYIATGDSGHGMTHGTIAGMLVSDLILGRPSRWRGLYDPARINLKADALVEYLRIGAHVAAHYADWLRAGDVPDPARIPPGRAPSSGVT